jgi:hypothetical protein
MQQQTCRVAYKDQFGISTIIPLCETAHIYARISGHKTLTRPTIDAMKELGIVFEVVQEQRSV